jgi:hypothetical protein
MPTRPTTTPSWATDANYPAGADPWSGTPTRVEPSAPQKGTGNTPATRPPAQHHNWLQGFIADWIAYFAAIIDSNEEHTYQAPKTRTVWIPCYKGVSSSDPAGDAQDWREDLGTGTTLSILSKRNSGWVKFHLSEVVPSGCTITTVNVLVDPGAARAAGNNMRAEVVQLDYGVGSALPVETTIGTDEDDESTNRQFLTILGVNTVVDRSDKHVSVRVRAGNTGLASADNLYGVLVTFTDIGPRNA